MVSSFRNFMASRNDRAATYAPPAPRVHQPDPNYAPFQESDYYTQFKRGEEAIRREGTTGWSAGSGWGGPTRIDTTEKSVESLRKEKQTEYDDWVRQQRELADAPTFKGMNGEEFDPNKESHREFIARDKVQYVREILPHIRPEEGADPHAKAEEVYYQQVLSTNGISSAPFPLMMPTNERINKYDAQVTNMLSPIEIAGQKTQVTGFQERHLQEVSGPRRARAFAGVVANPMNEEFIPIATAQAMGALPGAALGNETLEKAGATAGEWIGFGFGGVSAARSLRWMAEDISVPFKLIRGSYRAINKKFGTKDFRKPAQLSYVIDNAGQAPPSAALDADERRIAANFTPEENLAYAARDAGGTPPPSGSRIWVQTESQIRVEGQTETVTTWKEAKDLPRPEATRKAEVAPLTVVQEGELHKTYQITDTNSYFRASGEILNLSTEQIDQASKISRPIIKALADSFGIDEATYIQGLIPAVRGTQDIGQPYAARVMAQTDSGEQLGDALMDSVFRRSASLVEFIRTSPDLTNDADSMITVQHELAHIVLQDIFRLVTNGKGGQAGSVDRLSQSLKNQVLVRAELTGEDLTSAQRQAIDSLTTDDIAALMADSSHWQPSSKMAALRNSADQNQKLMARDLQVLLHEAGADLFAKYTFDVARGERITSTTREAWELYDDRILWQMTGFGLNEAFKLLRRVTDAPHGIATVRNAHEQKVVEAFSSVMDEVAAGKMYVDKKIAPEQLSYLAREYAKQKNTGNFLHESAISNFMLGTKRATLQQHRDEIKGDLVDSDLPNFFDGTNARYTQFANEIFTHPAWYPTFKKIVKKESGTAPLDTGAWRVNAGDQGIDELRVALTEVLSNPDSKFKSVHDVRPEVRARLELVDDNPEIVARLRETAFTNEAGEPTVFYTGVAKDYELFDHKKSRGFGNVAGGGKYATDGDYVGGSYAANRFKGDPDVLRERFGETSTARVQAYYSLVPPGKVFNIEGFGATDPVSKRFFENLIKDPRHQAALTARTRNLLNDSFGINDFDRTHKKTEKMIKHSGKNKGKAFRGDWEPDVPDGMYDDPIFAQKEIEEAKEARKAILSIYNNYRKAAMDLGKFTGRANWETKWQPSTDHFNGIEQSFGVDASRKVYRNFIEEFQVEVNNYREARGRHRGEMDPEDNPFDEWEDPYAYAQRAEENLGEYAARVGDYAEEPRTFQKNLEYILEQADDDPTGEIFDEILSLASARAVRRTLINEVELSKKTGAWDSFSAAKKAEQESAIVHFEKQENFLAAKADLYTIRDLDKTVYDKLGYKGRISGGGLQQLGDIFIRDMSTANVFEVMKSASMNRGGDLALMGNRSPWIAGPQASANFILYSARNRRLLESHLGLHTKNLKADVERVSESLLDDIDAGKASKAYIDSGNAVLDKHQTLWNDLWMDSDVHQLTEVGGGIIGASPHRVNIFTGSNEVINSNIAFVRLKGVQNTPDQAAAFKKRNPNAPSIEDTVRPGELGGEKTRYGNDVQSGVDKFNVGLNNIRKKMEEQNLGANSRAVENPARAGSDILDVQKKTEAGQVINTGKTDGKNIVPSSFKYEDFFGTSIRKPLNKELLDSVLTDTTGEFRAVTGEITPEGQKVLAESASERIEKMLKNRDYRAYIKARQKDIDDASTRGAAIAHQAKDNYAAGKIDFAELEKQNMIAKAKTESVKSGYKPIEMHPIEVQALMDHGVRKLQELYPRKVFDQSDFTLAINKFLGIETARRGTARFTEVAQEAPALKGVAGTKQVVRAEGLTPREQNLVEQALGLDTVLRDESPLTRAQIIRGIIITFFNVPRQLLLSIDAGAIFNQGGLLLGRFTTKGGYVDLGKSLKGTLSEGNYKSQMDQIKRDPDYDYLTTKTGIFISELDGPLTKREEGFMFNIFRMAGVDNSADAFTKKEKFIKATGKVLKRTGITTVGKGVAYPFKSGERFHNLYLNKMRYSMLRDFNAKLVKSGIDDAARDAAIKNYADFLNKATGRGDLGKLSNMAPELATVLLAPRWMVSRVQVPYTVAKTVGKEVKGGQGMYASKQIAQDLSRTFGVLGGISTLLYLNGFRVETDWRKSSFLKASNDGTNFVTGEQGSGKINIDLTMGLGSVWRFMARASYGAAPWGDRKEVTTTGTEFDADVGRQIGNFMRAKLSPLGASVTGLISGNNYFGEEITGREMFVPGQSWDYQDLLPLMTQQILEASEEMDGGPTLALLGAGAVGGLNVNVYPDKDDLAREVVGRSYEDLYPYEQKYINRLFYEGGKFQPSEYTQNSYQLELEQYETIEKIMNGPGEMGTKASRVYRAMDVMDIKMQGLRMGYFKNSEDAQPETDPLKKAQNDYYDLLSEIYGPEGQSSLSDEEIDVKKLRFLASLTGKQRDYIDANKTNFMVPNSVFKLQKASGKGNIKKASDNALRRALYRQSGRELPPELLIEDPMGLADNYYSVAKNIIYSNEARRRLSMGRSEIPTAPDQIEITRGILERVN